MKKITLEGKRYNCPTSWDEITLEMQIKVASDAEHFKHDVTKKIAIISGYIGIEPEVLKKIDIKKLGKLFRHLKFINEEFPKKQINEFEFKGHKYYVGQNLIQQEFQDYVSLENALQGTQGDVLKALPYVIAVLAKRKVDDTRLETLDDYDVEERAKEFNKLPFTIANNIGFFLSTSVNLFKATTQLYSNPKILVESKAEELLNTLNKQDGQGLFIRLQIGILKKYVKYIKRNVHKYFTSTQLKS